MGPAGYVVAGVVSAIVGLTPWLITGLRLPGQNLWASQALSDQMPIALLPFSQYRLAIIVALIVVGSALGGLFARWSRARHPRFALVSLIGGVAVVQITALVQTALTVEHGLRESRLSTLYLGALVAGTVASIVVGIGLLLLIARAPRAGVVVAISLVAVALESWLDSLVLPFGALPTPVTLALLGALRWVPAIIVGLSVAWAGLTSVGRIIAAVFGLFALWIVPAAVTAVTAATGSRNLAQRPAEMFDFGGQVFTSAIGPAGDPLPPLIVAVVVMVLALGARAAFGRWRVAQPAD